MIKEAIEFIANRVGSDPVKLFNKSVFLRDDYRVQSTGKTSPQAIHTTSLESFVELVGKFNGTSEYQDHADRFVAQAEICINGTTPRLKASLRFLPSSKEDYKEEQSVSYIEASPFSYNFPFSQFLSQEEFIINFLSAFELNDSSKRILKVVQKATATQTHSEEDDGVSQTTMMKQGIEETCVKVENPVTLPLRHNFAELPSIPAQFIFRKKINGSSVEFMLVAVPNTKPWLDAANEIRDYMKDAQENGQLSEQLLIV